MKGLITGALAALKRQAWPERVDTSPEWPHAFRESRRWCFLTLKPGTEPLKALVESFFDTWQLGATDPERVKLQNDWMELLRDGKAMLRRDSRLGEGRPPHRDPAERDSAKLVGISSKLQYRQRFESKRDGSAWLQGGDPSLRAVRGGHWLSFPQLLRAATRTGVTANNRNDYLGFRVGRTLTP
jgi:hypothetical protein